MSNWRECKGVEPSAHAEGRTPAELKSVRPTGTYPLPHCFVPVGLRAKQDYIVIGVLELSFDTRLAMVRAFSDCLVVDVSVVCEIPNQVEDDGISQ
jgi:hypothetical protein